MDRNGLLRIGMVLGPCFGRCGDSSLNTPFPDLFRMARFKDATVCQMISWNGDQIL